jgi:hypothetical protein
LQGKVVLQRRLPARTLAHTWRTQARVWRRSQWWAQYTGLRTGSMQE